MPAHPVPTPKQIKASAPTRASSIYYSNPATAPKGSFANPIQPPKEPADYEKTQAAEEQFAAEHP